LSEDECGGNKGYEVGDSVFGCVCCVEGGQDEEDEVIDEAVDVVIGRESCLVLRLLKGTVTQAISGNINGEEIGMENFG